MQEGEFGKKLIEENVRMGTGVVRRNAEVVAAIKERGLGVHGVVFDIGEGVLKEVDCGEGEEEATARVEAFHIH